MEPCDCCGKKVDERSLIKVGNYYVCPSCNGYYSETELIEKIERIEL
jgi:hypothetical protein